MTTSKSNITSSIYNQPFIEDSRIQTFYLTTTKPIYCPNILVGKMIKNQREPLLEPGSYNATLDYIDEKWYLNIGIDLYVVYDSETCLWKPDPHESHETYNKKIYKIDHLSESQQHNNSRTP